MLANGIDGKGRVLTELSAFWFDLLPRLIPGLHTHFISSEISASLRERVPAEVLAQLEGRSLIVQRVKVLPIESIVRGYITGSAWNSYQKFGTVCDIPLRAGLRESEKLERPLWTPSTKAEVGGSDENISPQRGNWPTLISPTSVQNRSIKSG